MRIYGFCRYEERKIFWSGNENMELEWKTPYQIPWLPGLAGFQGDSCSVLEAEPERWYERSKVW